MASPTLSGTAAPANPLQFQLARRLLAWAANRLHSLKPSCAWGTHGFVGVDEVTDYEGWHIAFDWLGLHLMIGGGLVQNLKKDHAVNGGRAHGRL